MEACRAPPVGGVPGGSRVDSSMIELTKLAKQQDEKIVVNADLIEFIERTPDTLISTTTGKKLMVKETVDEVIEKVVAYRRRCTPVSRNLA
jgi:flagellar protein FlbD